MKYLFGIEAWPGSKQRGVKLKDGALPYEFHTPEQTERANIVGLPVRLSHMGGDVSDVGKIIATYKPGDGSIVAFCYATDDSIPGSIAISDLQKGLIKYGSIKYAYSVFSTDTEIKGTDVE